MKRSEPGITGFAAAFLRSIMQLIPNARQVYHKVGGLAKINP